jgi:hypothetical protein
MTLLKPSDYHDLLNVCAEYVQIEQGDTNYEIAHEWVEKHWPDPIKVAGGIRILEETWNRAFYDRRRGIFHMGHLKEAIKQYTSVLDQLRRRHIDTFGSGDHAVTQMLWGAFFEALKPQKKPESPYVATAKALHLLVPTFFVPLDSKIAKNYGCNGPQPRDYIRFQEYMAELASHILDSFVTENGGDRERARFTICGSLYMQQTGSHYGKQLPKLLDEYNWKTRFLNS